MAIHENLPSGWVESDGEPRWRATLAARKMIIGAEIRLSVFKHPRRTHIFHLKNGYRVATLRYLAGHRRWLLDMEGFQFWHYNRVLGYAHFLPTIGFDNIREAHAFLKKVFADSSARFIRSN